MTAKSFSVIIFISIADEIRTEIINKYYVHGTCHVFKIKIITSPEAVLNDTAWYRLCKYMITFTTQWGTPITYF
jgi:hypothetical protein